MIILRYGMQWKIYHTQYRDNSVLLATNALKNIGLINCEKTQHITQNCIVLGMRSKDGSNWCHEQDFFLKQSHTVTSEPFSLSWQLMNATTQTYTWWCFRISEYQIIIISNNNNVVKVAYLKYWYFFWHLNLLILLFWLKFDLSLRCEVTNIHRVFELPPIKSTTASEVCLPKTRTALERAYRQL